MIEGKADQPLAKVVEKYKEFITIHNVKTVLALFSGGRDSLVATDMSYKATKSLDVNFEVLYVNTTCALPGVQDYVGRLRELLGWPLRILTPKIDFWTLVKKWGAPTPRRRWCCYHLKLEPIREYTKRVMPPRIHVLGLRATESSSRLKKANNGQFKQFYWDSKSEVWVYNPIFWWDDLDVEKYIKKNSLPVSPVYERIAGSGECFCGAFKTVGEIRQVKTYYPEFFQRLVQLESEFRNGGSLFYIQSKRVYAKDL